MDIGDDHVEARLHDAERAAREHRALVIEPAHQHFHAVVHGPEHVRVRHLALLEHQFRRGRAAHAELVEFLGRAETLHALLDEEGGDAARPGGGIGLGIDDERVGFGAVGDPHLAAVQDVAVALAFGPRRHRDDVRARARLAHGERADMLARDELRQIAPLLRRRAVAADLVDAQVRVRAVRESDRGRAAAHLLHRHDMREIAHAGAAQFLLDGDAEQADGAELRPKIARERVVAVDRCGARRDLGVGEVAHAVAQHVDLGAEIEIEHRVAIGGHRFLAVGAPVYRRSAAVQRDAARQAGLESTEPVSGLPRRKPQCLTGSSLSPPQPSQRPSAAPA